MTAYSLIHIPVYIRSVTGVLILSTVFFTVLGCDTSQTVVRKTTETITQATRDLSRKIVLSDEDLKRKVGILKFENNMVQKAQSFQEIFHRGLPEYLSGQCPGIILSNPAAGGLLNELKETPKLKSGLIDGYALAILGRQLGLNAVVTGSLEDIRIIEDSQGILWTKDKLHLVQIFIRMEVFDTRTATKILDKTVDRRIEVDEIDFQMTQDREQIKLPELNETLNLMLIDIGDSICNAVRDQPWDGYITEINGDRYIVPSGANVGLETGDILEVFDSSRTMEAVGGQRFFIPGLKIGEIEVVTIAEDRLEAKLVSGEDIKRGSTVRRK
jgi:hypothetical protein